MMRAKVHVTEVKDVYAGAQQINFAPVCDSSFGPNGESEDNTYARYTPSGGIWLTITNPNLLGQFAVGQRYYVDFTATTPAAVAE